MLTVPCRVVLELLLFDRARDRTADQVAFQDLMVGHLIGAVDHPIAQFGQARGRWRSTRGPFSARCLNLRSRSELSVSSKSGGVANQRRARSGMDSLGALMDGTMLSATILTGQILAGPVGDVQALGYGFQAGQFNDLSTFAGEIAIGRPDRGANSRRPG